MSKEIEKLARHHGVEAEYYAAERIAEGIVATLNGLAWLGGRFRSALTRHPAGAPLPPKRDLASS